MDSGREEKRSLLRDGRDDVGISVCREPGDGRQRRLGGTRRWTRQLSFAFVGSLLLATFLSISLARHRDASPISLLAAHRGGGAQRACDRFYSSQRTLGRPPSTSPQLGGDSGHEREQYVAPCPCGMGRTHLRECDTFLWIGDLHVDLHFDPRVPATGSNGTGVCRQSGIPTDPMSTTDMSEATSSPFGYGRVGCDPPPRLLHSLMQAMRAADPHPAFVLVTGDLSAHAMPNRTAVLHNLRYVTAALHEGLCGGKGRDAPSDVPCRFAVALGNMDVFPDNYIEEGNASDTVEGAADVDTDDPVVHLRDIYRIYTDAGLIDADDATVRQTFLRGGYYRAYDDANVRVLVLNTLYYTVARVFRREMQSTADQQAPGHRPFATIPCAARMSRRTGVADDPAGQLEWLRTELADARRRERAVLLASHVAPGDKDGAPNWCAHYAEAYARILSEFRDVMAMQFFGDHTRDEWRAWRPVGARRGESETAIPALIHPGLTPRKRRFGAPVFRNVFFGKGIGSGRWQHANISPATVVLDYYSWAFPLADTAMRRAMLPPPLRDRPKWRWRYSFCQQYGVADMSPEGMTELARRMAHNDTLLQAYLLRMNDGYEGDIDFDQALLGVKLLDAV
ncbi:hypothetical protein CDCA_CDCA14G3869 [Cyanidium caldarium]|uniref:Calcineurin-like phosphoesterase domain-containing protein n=1 Tax=Cyanidium caldarium TaxID=2771 RepID=A0AAV9J0J1_CYACA|nr:hypothetical protein CDCA_CDCA14G3869 [Cyanidium caldarium]